MASVSDADCRSTSAGIWLADGCAQSQANGDPDCIVAQMKATEGDRQRIQPVPCVLRRDCLVSRPLYGIHEVCLHLSHLPQNEGQVPSGMGAGRLAGVS